MGRFSSSSCWRGCEGVAICCARVSVDLRKKDCGVAVVMVKDWGCLMDGMARWGNYGDVRQIRLSWKVHEWLMMAGGRICALAHTGVEWNRTITNHAPTAPLVSTVHVRMYNYYVVSIDSTHFERHSKDAHPEAVSEAATGKDRKTTGEAEFGEGKITCLESWG